MVVDITMMIVAVAVSLACIVGVLAYRRRGLRLGLALAFGVLLMALLGYVGLVAATFSM